MSDESVARLLRSKEPLVVIEASAGCGKTFQGASYAREIVSSLGYGRLLILTHTHAACAVFADRTKGAGTQVEIMTIDALVTRIASAYHVPLGLPKELSSWAYQNNGFALMAAKVAAYMRQCPFISRVLAQRYPVVICDEHQDSSADQHSIVMTLVAAGAQARIFGDPMQNIYGGKTQSIAEIHRQQWEQLKESGVFGQLDVPHRWAAAADRALGAWILNARYCLQSGKTIDLSGSLPSAVRVLTATNIAARHDRYSLCKLERSPIDKMVANSHQLMVLAAQNDRVKALRAFWFRSIPIWEGHTRNALADLVSVLHRECGDATTVAHAMNAFISRVAVGFSPSSHGNRLMEEIKNGVNRAAKGKGGNIQMIAKLLLTDPSHTGVAAALTAIRTLNKDKAMGFSDIKIDLRSEFNDAIKLGQFTDPNTGYAEIMRNRSYAHPTPPQKVLSTIHKASGLECDNVLLMDCDKSQFSNSNHAKCVLYVALSRAKKSITLVVPESSASALIRLN
jgi:AAA domain/UvrD-like helicase C-terminal domain